MKITADDFIKNLESNDTTLAMLVTLKEVEGKSYSVNVMIDDGVENASLRAVISGILRTMVDIDGGLDAVLAGLDYLEEEARAKLDLMEPAGVELWS